MVHIVGAGPGAVDLITVRGQELLKSADVVIYAGSLVNVELLRLCRSDCRGYDSALMTLDEVMDTIQAAETEKKMTVRLHTGDPCLYGAIKEQMDAMDRLEIKYEICPGVSSFCGAAAALGIEYTLPDVSQTVIITRVTGRTSVPKREQIRLLAEHQTTMVFFLSTGLLDELTEELLAGGYSLETPAAIVYKATWADEQKYLCTIAELEETAKRAGIHKTALILVGDVLSTDHYSLSKLYAPDFTTEFRHGKE